MVTYRFFVCVCVLTKKYNRTASKYNDLLTKVKVFGMMQHNDLLVKVFGMMQLSTMQG